jgi:hypothetical protein
VHKSKIGAMDRPMLRGMAAVIIGVVRQRKSTTAVDRFVYS